MRHLKYLSYVLRHKWYVFLECYKLGIPFQGIIHDWSKFRPSEWFPYVNFFYSSRPQIRDETGYYKPHDTGDEAFDFAWLLHQKRNKHHWQWWILPTDEEGLKIFNMPLKYRKEMLADWRGAGRAQGTPNTRLWYEKHAKDMTLHVDVSLWLESNI